MKPSNGSLSNGVLKDYGFCGATWDGRLPVQCRFYALKRSFGAPIAPIHNTSDTFGWEIRRIPENPNIPVKPFQIGPSQIWVHSNWGPFKLGPFQKVAFLD